MIDILDHVSYIGSACKEGDIELPKDGQIGQVVAQMGPDQWLVRFEEPQAFFVLPEWKLKVIEKAPEHNAINITPYLIEKAMIEKGINEPVM